MKLDRAHTGEGDARGRSQHSDAPLSGSAGDSFELAQVLIGSRQNVSPKRLIEPGPTTEQLHALLSLAAAAPDHGLLTPWRFIIVPADQRHRLAEVFALALIDRDPGATLEQIEAAREKAHRAPLLMVAVCCVNIGTVSKRNPGTRTRPLPAAFVTELARSGPAEAVQ